MELNDYEIWIIGSNVVSGIVAVVVAVIAFVQRKHDVAMKSIDKNSNELKEMHHEHSNRITALETQVKNMPEFKNMEDIRKDMTGLSNQIGKITGQLFSIEKKLSMIDQHLMDKK